MIFVYLGFLHTIYHVIHESIFATPLSLHRNETSTRVQNIRCAPFLHRAHNAMSTHLSRKTFKIRCSIQMLHKITQMCAICCVVSVCLCVSVVDSQTIHFCHRLPFHLNFVLVPDSLNTISLNCAVSIDNKKTRSDIELNI